MGGTQGIPRGGLLVDYDYTGQLESIYRAVKSLHSAAERFLSALDAIAVNADRIASALEDIEAQGRKN